MSEQKYAYSEIFYSMQGEGKYTGEPTAWLRFFLCNLQCNGFGQKDPTNPDTYELPYKDVDASAYDRIEDLPVFEYGCDSSYSWSKKFAHLQNKQTIPEIAQNILNKIPVNSFNNNTHMCFTGGEPLLKHAQKATVELMKHYDATGQKIPSVTFETNGTQPLSDDFVEYWAGNNSTELFFSLSPKLWSVAGEKFEKAIKPEVVKQYHDVSSEGQLKFVCNGTDTAWAEIEKVVDIYRQHGVYYPVWIMPVGATLEGQKGEIEGHMTDGDVAHQALARGYRVSARVHVYLWGNTIGV